MHGQTVKSFAGIAFRLEHFLQSDLLGLMLKALTLKPSAVPHRPGLGPVVDPAVAQQERRYELTFVAPVLRRAFTGAELCREMGDAACEGGVSWRVSKPARTSRRSDTPWTTIPRSPRFTSPDRWRTR